MAGTLKYFNEKLGALFPEDQSAVIDTLDWILSISHTTPKEERKKALYLWLRSRAASSKTTEKEFIDFLFSKPLEEMLNIIRDLVIVEEEPDGI